MWTAGPIILFSGLTLLCASHPSSAPCADQPPATPTPRAQQSGDGTRLSDYASRTAIDRSCVGSPPGEPLVITSEMVRHLASGGVLTVGDPRIRLSPRPSRPTASMKSSNATRIEEEWREKVLRQKDRVAKIQGDLLLLDARIETINASVAHGRDGEARRQAKIVEARGRRTVLARRLERERTRLGVLIRHAREQGAQPGWFR